MMNISTGSPFLLSLMSTVASIPFFLFTLLAGALADKLGRQKLLCFVNHFSDSGVDADCGLSSSNLGLLFTSMGVGLVVGAVFIIPRLRASLQQLKAAVEYGQVMPNTPEMGRFF